MIDLAKSQEAHTLTEGGRWELRVVTEFAEAMWRQLRPRKHGRERADWRNPEDIDAAISDHLTAALRHLSKGERDLKDDTDEHNLVAAATRLMMALELMMKRRMMCK